MTSDTGVSELFNKSSGNLCHGLSSNSIVKSQNTRFTLRTAWHLPAGSGLLQGVECLPSPCGQHSTLILPGLLSAAHATLHCAELYCHSTAQRGPTPAPGSSPPLAAHA